MQGLTDLMEGRNENARNNNTLHVPYLVFDGGKLDMKQSIILHDRFMIARAVMAIQGVEFDPLHEVVIRPHKEQRSIQQ
ncbi:MAG: hypothetical protein GY943_37110, partial [Chloroflexi bacterium]|nr:hypothetical protein [Chloroflexota bacterium]